MAAIAASDALSIDDSLALAQTASGCRKRDLPL
jgi:hypothetical protein